MAIPSAVKAPAKTSLLPVASTSCTGKVKMCGDAMEIVHYFIVLIKGKGHP